MDATEQPEAESTDVGAVEGSGPTEPQQSRRPWLLLLLPVIITVLLGVGLGGYVVIENKKQADRIDHADDLGADFLSESATFRDRIAAALSDVDDDDPAALRVALKEAAANPPALDKVDPDAAELSSTYREAETAEQGLMKPYETLAQALKKAEADLTFFDAAEHALTLDANDFVTGTQLSSSGELRTNLIPAFVKERDAFARVPVPKGAETTAKLVTSALQGVIDGATGLADSIDAGRNDSFGYGEQHKAAAAALNDFSAQANGDFTEAMNAVDDLTD